MLGGTAAGLPPARPRILKEPEYQRASSTSRACRRAGPFSFQEDPRPGALNPMERAG